MFLLKLLSVNLRFRQMSGQFGTLGWVVSVKLHPQEVSVKLHPQEVSVKLHPQEVSVKLHPQEVLAAEH